MVAYLLNPLGSEDFHQIVDFLHTSHIKFALTENPTIYTSLIQWFWQTASISTLEDGEMEITATIDGQLKTITEASLRRHLKLEDAGGPIQQSERSTIPVKPHLTLTSAPSTSHLSTSTPSMQTTYDTEEPATMPHDSSHSKVQSLGSDEGSLTLNELTVLCATLSKKVEDLQSNLKQTKLTYGAAYTKLIMRVKKLEHKVKLRQSRRRTRVVISDTEEDLDDPSKQGRRIAKIDQTPSILLVQDKGTSWIQEDADIQGRTSTDTEILLDQEEPTELVEDLGSGEKGKKEISTAGVSTAEAVLSTVIPEVSTAAKNLVYIRRSAEKRKGKAIMKEDESAQKKTKKQLEQERLSHEATIRLQEQVNKEERQR
ncbi:hypothetical protein Tco_1461993, partial [Tanacetum coccineum]